MGAGFTPETLFTIASDPWDEIRRVATVRDCESILLGLSSPGKQETARLEGLLNEIVMHAVVLHAPEGWKLENAKRVLVTVGGKGRHDELRARLLGSLVRLGQRRITFVTVVPEGATTGPASLNELRSLADEETPSGAESIVVRGANVTDAITELAESIQADLIVMGTPRESGRKSLGRVALGVANQVSCATLMICRESSMTRAIRLSSDLTQTVIRGPWSG